MNYNVIKLNVYERKIYELYGFDYDDTMTNQEVANRKLN